MQNDVKLFHETIMFFRRQINGKSSEIDCAYSQAIRPVDAYYGRITQKTGIKFKKNIWHALKTVVLLNRTGCETFHETKESQ